VGLTDTYDVLKLKCFFAQYQRPYV